MFIRLYKILITLVYPLMRGTYIKKRQKIGKEHPTRFGERIGQYSVPRPEGKLYWLHGASVGEAISMLPLIDKLLKSDDKLSILVTTGTVTSAEIMEKRLPKRAFHQFFPLDVPMFCRRFLTHFKPDAVLWFESELWPSMLSEIKRAKIPLILVNGRISDHSFANWKRLKFIAKELLGCFSLCLGQSVLDMERLQVLGAKKVACYGNLKYAGLPLPVDKEKLDALKKIIGGRRVFLISSTHYNEEEMLAQEFGALYQEFPDVLVIIVPRHPHRGEEVAEMLKEKGYKTKRRSVGDEITDDTAVYVADTIGEMGLWYKLAEISFVGGSLIAHGGQNFMEAARDKNAVIFGKHMFNFKDMLARAREAQAVLEEDDAKGVMARVVALLKDKDELLKSKTNAYDWTVKEAGVLDGIAEALKQELENENTEVLE